MSLILYVGTERLEQPRCPVVALGAGKKCQGWSERFESCLLRDICGFSVGLSLSERDYVSRHQEDHLSSSQVSFYKTLVPTNFKNSAKLRPPSYSDSLSNSYACIYRGCCQEHGT